MKFDLKGLVPGRVCFVVFMLAVAARLAVFAYISYEPRKFFTYDSNGYDQRALTLLEYGVFSEQEAPPFKPDLERTPGYPAFLAIIFAVAGHKPAVVILCQIVIGSLTAPLAFALARELHLPAIAGLFAALVTAVDPVSVMTANRLLTETLYTFLTVLGIWLALRFLRTPRILHLLGAAVVLAAAALTRPIGQFLPLALLPMFLLAARRKERRALLASGLLFVVITSAITYSWAYRNYQVGGQFTLSVITDINLIYYRARAVLADARGVSQDTAWAQLEAEIDHMVAVQGLTAAQRRDLERNRAFEIFQRYPMLTARMFATGAARLLLDPGYTITCTLLDRESVAYGCFPGESSMNEPGVGRRALWKFTQMDALQQTTLIWSLLLLLIIYTGAGIGVLWLLRARAWLPLVLLTVLVAYFTLLAAGAEANSRFRVPAVPYLAILAGVGLDKLVDYLSTRRAFGRKWYSLSGGIGCSGA